jgi:molecular chaperone GrpE (heat shock protein)
MARSNPKLLYPQTAKKSAAKNSAAKNSAANKSAANKSAANKSAANKSVTNTSAANTSVAKKSVASRIAELQTQVAQGRDKIGKRTVKYNLKLCLMEQEVQRLMHKIENLRENTWP